MEKFVLNRKDVHLKQGKPQTIKIGKTVNTANTSLQFEHAYDGRQKYVTVKFIGTDGSKTTMSLVLLSGIQKKHLLDHELLNESITDISEIELETKESELQIAFSVLEETNKVFN